VPLEKLGTEASRPNVEHELKGLRREDKLKLILSAKQKTQLND
jgi:hypothetical protein